MVYLLFRLVLACAPFAFGAWLLFNRGLYVAGIALLLCFATGLAFVIILIFRADRLQRFNHRGR